MLSVCFRDELCGHVVPSVRLPRVRGHNLVPPRPVTAAAVGRRVRGARRDSLAQQAGSTYAPINKYITSVGNKT